MINDERMQALEWLWDEETDEEEARAWRDTLNQEEQKVIADWDNSYNAAVGALSGKILDIESRRKTRQG